MSDYNCIVVLGPTASGKTRLACQLAYELGGEVISADSRQVYRHLNVGTGKDLEEYEVNGTKIPYHLIDIEEPGGQFYLHQFAAALKEAFDLVHSKDHLPVICGGTGLYLDALRKDFSFTQVPEDHVLRGELEPLSKEELLLRLGKFPRELWEHVDTNSKKRIIRGLEVAAYRAHNALRDQPMALPYKPLYVGVAVSLGERRKRIAERLGKRLDEGMIGEVEALLGMGLSHGRLQLLGLEYKFISLFLQQKITRQEMQAQLQTAIFQFAKRQMTWFRKMEKEGVRIHWLEPRNAIREILGLMK